LIYPLQLEAHLEAIWIIPNDLALVFFFHSKDHQTKPKNGEQIGVFDSKQHYFVPKLIITLVFYLKNQLFRGNC
jgi:hypothetical protein